jgi:hypothetical protein
LDDLRLNLQRQGGLDPVVEVIWDLADRGGLTLEDPEKYEPATPSFSNLNASWKDFILDFNLDPSKGFIQFHTFSFLVASLPPSFRREVMKAPAKWLDVYRERGAHDREAAGVLHP